VELIEVFEALGIAPQAWLEGYLSKRGVKHLRQKIPRKISS
jgi:hypothetical protein